MNSCNSKRRSGLILLVVLGMLSLFSMLAITYVVFASQSRTANLAMARGDFRGTPAPKLLDDVTRVLIRGTTDSRSALHLHDLLGDMYGQAEVPDQLIVRDSQLLGGAPMSNSALERPILTAGSFVRIPIAPRNYPTVPMTALASQSDIFTGRVVTFLSGPLANISFRVIRWRGDTTPASLPQVVREQAYSIVIDLSEVQDSIVSAVVDRAGSGAGAELVSQPISDWITNDFFNLFYANANGAFTGGYRLLLNAPAFNGVGAGVTRTGVTQTVRLAGPLDDPMETDNVARGPLSAAFQPNLGAISHKPILPTGSVSDSDESYDAPDYKNFFLSYIFPHDIDVAPFSTASPFPQAEDVDIDGDGVFTPFTSEDVIPSFHRAALINYLVNESEPKSYTQAADLVAMLYRIQAATGRTLSMLVRPDNNPLNPPFISVNPNFSGSNAGEYPSGTDSRSPQLSVIFDRDWGTGMGNDGLPAFQNWVRLLTRGPWDVDNDDDGVNDSIWADPNFPLMTSAEGKLLKALVAFQIEDLDSRLDINAVGDLAQAEPSYSSSTDLDYGVGVSQFFTQGSGIGPAETSFRHLFASDVAYRDFLRRRYQVSTATAVSNFDVPGRPFDDLYSIFGIREVPVDFGTGPAGALTANNHNWRYSHRNLPGLPLATRGRHAIGVDLLGNPLLLNGADGVTTPGNITDPPFDVGVNSPYESPVLTSGSAESFYTFSDWERSERQYDQDRSSMSRRLEAVSHENMRLFTPRSRHVRATALASSRAPSAGHSQAFYGMIKAIGELRPTPITLNEQMYSELFPLEFRREEPLNLNRALGNGFDDDNDGQFDEPQELGLAVFDGLDNDGDGQTDEFDETNGPTESQRTPDIDILGQSVVLSTQQFESYLLGSTNMDPTYDDTVRTSNGERRRFYGSQTRQLLARHLYCLAMLLMPDDFVPSNRPVGRGLTPAQQAAERARMLAQWAVNVVDFRDADSVMTRFPYDPTPFDFTAGAYWHPNPDPAAGEVVWGMEQPEVVMTESLAFHDVRVRDTKEDSTGDKTTDPMTTDNDYDQLRIPEGSAYIELRALRTTTDAASQIVPGVPSSLYGINSNNRVALDLGRVTPSNATGVQFPVWRIAVSEPHASGSDTPDKIIKDVARRSAFEYQFPNVVPASNTTYTVNPSRNGLEWERGSTTNPAPVIDRVIWFTNTLTPSHENLPDVKLPLQDGLNDAIEARSRVYDNRFGQTVLLEGGQQLVIGPREITYLGSKQAAIGAPMNPVNEPNDHRIVMQNNALVPNNTPPALDNWVTTYAGDNTQIGRRAALTTNATINGPSRTLTMVAATIPDWDPNVMPTKGNLPTEIGFNVTAPHPILTDYYPTPTDQLNSANTAKAANGALGFGDVNQPADAYHDYAGGSANQLDKLPFDGRNSFPLGKTWSPGYDKGIPQPGTAEDWCTAYLQRLADPELPWHSVFNPYITVDWIPFDVTVFSGEERVTGGNFRFASRQKSGAVMNVDLAPTPGNTGKTFLSYISEGVTTDPPGRVSGAFFNRELPMDSDPTQPSMPARPTIASNHFATLGYLNSSFRLRGDLPVASNPPSRAGFEGAPADVPASLIWMNRQFANVYELTLVPNSHPGQIMQEFSERRTGGAAANVYYNAGERSPYSYLMNWFQAPATAAGLPGIAPAAIFELATTPSPWADARKHISPAVLSASFPLAPLRAPYNWVSRFVEPGRVNINTVASPFVWQGLMWNSNPTVASRTATSINPPYWSSTFAAGSINASLRGGSAPNIGFIPNTSSHINRLNANVPTQFNGVFKSVFEAGFVPAQRSSVPAADQLDALARIQPIHATLARSNGTTNDQALLAPGTSATGVTVPAFSTGVPKAAFEEYQQFSRLVNLTTTRSNVFSIRVTIGFFEFDPVTGLGQEYGIDEGRSKRHRAFYVIDRSIPVGYEQGQDLNTDKCILLRRVIE